MTSKTTTKTTSPKTSSPRTSRKSSPQQSRKNSRKHFLNKSHRINRQRRLQKQLQALLLERHSRRCIICHHPEREAIEEEFVHWRAPWKLSQDYKLADYRTVYRHARAAGLLLQRRERLHSALDAFVESVDDVTFTGDTILRAMRAYSCIDSHGRWTEVPTQVQFSTSHDGHPSQPSPRTSNVGPSVRSNAASSLHSGILDVAPKNSNNASRSDATACAGSPRPSRGSSAQAFNVPDFDDDPEDDDDDRDEEPEHDAEEDAENELEERVTALDVLNVIRKYSNQAPRSDATTCAKSSAQAPDLTEDEYAEPEDDDSDANEESEEEAENALEECVISLSTSSKSMSRSDTTACAAPPAQSVVPLSSNHRGRTVTAAASASASSKTTSHSDATACADSPAQALPRDVVRGQNPNDRSLSDRTDCAAKPAQLAAPPKPKPDADGLIWHPHPGYPNQEMSEPDAQGRVRYKIHMTTAASQLPSRETDAQRAAKLIYRSVIKKYGNP